MSESEPEYPPVIRYAKKRKRLWRNILLFFVVALLASAGVAISYLSLPSNIPRGRLTEKKLHSMRQLGIAISSYVKMNDGQLPVNLQAAVSDRYTEDSELRFMRLADREEFVRSLTYVARERANLAQSPNVWAYESVPSIGFVVLWSSGEAYTQRNPP